MDSPEPERQVNYILPAFLLGLSFGMFIAVFKLRLKWHLSKTFHNPSYQLGMVFASACLLFVLSFVITLTGGIKW